MDRSSEPGVPTTGPTPKPDGSPEGVDRTLIRWILSLTPAERLKALQSFVDGVWAALRHVRRS